MYKDFELFNLVNKVSNLLWVDLYEYKNIPFWGLLTAITINAFKILPEISLGETHSIIPKKGRKLKIEREIRKTRSNAKGQSKELCLIICTFQEKSDVVITNITTLINKNLFSPSQIIFVSDGCNDPWYALDEEERIQKKERWDTLGQKERDEENLKWYDTGELLVIQGILPKNNILVYPNGKKVGSQKKALNDLHLTDINNDILKYIGFVDADILYDGGYIPVEEMEEKGCIGAALNIIPILREGQTGIQARFIQEVQIHEYMTSMMIGKIFASRTESIGTISGAFGIFEKENLKRNMEKETGRFPGDDQQRTLWAIIGGGKILFFKNIVYTFCPHTLWELQMQRTQKWWPGLWDNLPKMLKVLFSRQKHIALRLRFEMFYESLFVLDIFKIYGLFYMIYYELFWQIGILSVFYMFIESLAVNKIKKLSFLHSHYWALPFIILMRLANIIWRTVAFFELMDTFYFKTGAIKKINKFLLKSNK